MKKIILKTTLTASLFCMAAVSMPAHAATKGVGKAIISIGKVFATGKDGAEKKLKRRGKVFEGDTIKVGKKSRLQLRFVDNQLVVLKANTVFRIDEYKFKDKNDQNKSAALSLLKGGMRSVTGLIGKSARDKYKVKTPVATMGVRGTHYVLQLCAPGACGNGSDQGLYGTVVEGAIEMQNDGGSVVFGVDQFFHVPSNNEVPKGITNPPSALVDRSNTQKDDDGKDGDGKDGDGKDGDGTGGDGTGGDGTGGDGTGDGTGGDGTGDGTGGDGTGDGLLPPPDDEGPLLLPPDEGPISCGSCPPPPPPPTVEPGEGFVLVGTPAPLGAVLAISGITPGGDGAGGIVGVEGANASIGLMTIGMADNQPTSAFISDQFGDVSYTTFGGTPVEVGGNGMIGVNWGRWLDSDIVFTDNGATSSLLTGIAFVYSDNATTPAQLAGLTGFQTYDLTGGPSIRDETGAILSGGASIDVDFSTQQIVDFYGGLSGNGRSYSFGATGPTSFSAFTSGGEIDLNGICSGGVCSASTPLTGSAGGAFVGPGAEGVIGNFGLDGPNGVGVSGSGLFEPGCGGMC